MRFTCCKLSCLATALLSVWMPLTTARAAVFDFEGEPATSPPHSGALTELVMTDAGLTITVIRPELTGRVPFDIIDNVGEQEKPAEFGLRSLNPFFAGDNPAPFVADFSLPASSVSVTMGDYSITSPESDDLLLEAFSGPGATGTLLDSDSFLLVPISADVFNFHALSVSSATPIQSIRFVGGGALFPNSVYYDQIAVTLVPEPAALVLALLGAVGLVICRRWMGQKPVA